MKKHYAWLKEQYCKRIAICLYILIRQGYTFGSELPFVYSRQNTDFPNVVDIIVRQSEEDKLYEEQF